jgi:hypothetical protein
MRFSRATRSLTVALSSVIYPQVAAAQTPAPPGASQAGTGSSWEAEAPRERSGPRFTLVPNPGWSGTLGVSGALAVLSGTDARSAYSLAGAALRVRYGYVGVGGYYELSDRLEDGRLDAFGGQAGAWLPFQNWLDFEIAVRGGLRRFADDDPRFGPSGYAVSGPTLGLLMGVSGRMGESWFGQRIGGALVTNYDLVQHDQAWRYEAGQDLPDGPVVYRGTNHVGGLSIAIMLELGFDVSD